MCEWSGFVVLAFEEMIRELIFPHLLSEYEQYGSWWNRRGDEIDLFATGPAGSLAIGIKNRTINLSDSTGILKDLEKKISFVKGLQYPVIFGIAGQKVEGKEELVKKGFRVYELSDLIISDE